MKNKAKRPVTDKSGPRALEAQVRVFGCRQFARAIITFLWPPPARIPPTAWYGQTAFRAASIFEPVLLHVVPRAANQRRLACWAQRVRTVAVNISLIHVVKPNLQRDLAGRVQCFRRVGRLVP